MYPRIPALSSEKGIALNLQRHALFNYPRNKRPAQRKRNNKKRNDVVFASFLFIKFFASFSKERGRVRADGPRPCLLTLSLDLVF